jgi:tetratricopeptide (TPR) repeat protein
MRWTVLAVFMGLAVLAGTPARATQNDPRLPRLLAALRVAQPAGWAKAIEGEIIHIWSESADTETEHLMETGLTAMAEDEDDAALQAFDAAIVRSPYLAAGWSERSEVEYLLGDYKASVTDAQHALQLEPRNFVALANLGRAQMALGDRPAALKAFTAALVLDPHLDDVADAVERLKKEAGNNPA